MLKPSTQITPPERLPLRINRAYQLLIAGRTLTLVGASMASLAGMLLAYDLTHDSSVTGTVMSLNLVGMLVTTLLAGVTADRFNRKYIMTIASLTQGCLLFSISIALWTDTLSIVQLGITLFLLGAVSAFFVPAEQAALKQVVKPNDFPAALAANQTGTALASILGPSLAGALHALNRLLPFLIDAILNFLAAILTLLVKVKLQPVDLDRQSSPFVKSMMAGVWYLVQHTILRPLIVILGLATFGFWGMYLGITLALQDQGQGAQVLGLLQASFGAGGLIGAVLASPILKHIPVGTLSAVTLLLLLAICVVMLFVSSPALLIVLIGLAGLMLPSINVGLLACALRLTPDALQGRMTSILTLATLAMGPLASTLAGFLIEHANSTIALVPGTVSLLLAFLIVVLSHRIRSIPTVSDINERLTERGDINLKARAGN